MEQLLPFKELTADQLGNRATVRANTIRGEEEVMIPLEKIFVRPGVNPRIDFNKEYLEELANSLLEHGQDLPGRVDVLKDNTFALVDGECRYRAWKIIEARGVEDIHFKAIVNKKDTTEEDRLLQIANSQRQQPFHPYEWAEIVRRMLAFGNKQEAIAKKLSKTAAWVSQMCVYLRQPQEIKNRVINGEITLATAVQINSTIKSAEERVEAVNDAIATNKSTKRKPNADTIGANAIRNAGKRKFSETLPPTATPNEPDAATPPQPSTKPTDPPVLRAARAIADFFSMPLESIAQIVNLIEANIK